MTIEIYVENFRGIKLAHLTCSPIGLIVAPNDFGKSSVAQAVAAVLTGIGLDKQFELTQATAGQLVHDGENIARCIVRGPDGEARMAWPEAKRSQTGAAPPSASVYAAGLKSILDITPAERATALAPYLKSLPSKEDLIGAMQDKFTQDAIDRLWDELQAKGWDKTASDWEIARRQANAEWRNVTSETFGEQKAAAWRPAGLNPTLAGSTVAQLQAAVTAAKAAVETAVASSALADAERHRLQELADDYVNRADALAKAGMAVSAAQAAKTSAIQSRAALPVTTVAHMALVCPHCGEKTVLRDLPGQSATLEKYEEIDESVLKARRMAIADADGRVNNTTSALSEAETKRALAQNALDEAKEARDRLLSAPNAQDGQMPASTDDIAAAREKLTTSENNLVLRQKMDAAAAAFQKWRGADARLTILEPAGLRAATLSRVIDVFNTGVLAPLCEIASWPAVTLSQELTGRIGGRAYSLVSVGMQWRTRLVLQAAQASLDSSTMMIIDNLPDLDANARNGLFCILQHLKLPALICMANISEVAALDLAKHHLGGSWHIIDGKTEPFGVLAEKERAI